MQNYLPHYCLNPPTAAWSQCFFLTRLYEFLGVFEQWFAGWEEASAEPEELPALGLTVPVNAKPTVLLQPHIILCLTTQPATGKRNALPSWSHGWFPWSQRAANQQSLHPGSGINLLGNNHNLDMQSQVLHEKYSWQMQTSWINIYSSLADILAAVTLVPSSWKATIDLVFKLTCIQMVVSQWMYSPALCTGQLCSGHEHFACTGFPLHVLLFCSEKWTCW